MAVRRYLVRRWCSTWEGRGGGGDFATTDAPDGWHPQLRDERFAAKYRAHLEEEKQRIPLQHPDSLAQERAAEKAQTRAVKDAVKHPRNLEPFVPDTPVDTKGTAGAWEGRLEPGIPDYASLAMGAPAPPPFPAGAPDDALRTLDPATPPAPRTQRRRRYGHEVRYRRYQRMLQAFKTTREETRVLKLQRVVAAGLATEADYARELKRLGIDVLKYPLPFRPRAYMQSEQRETIRAFLLESVAASHSGHSQAEAALAKLEAVLSEDMAAREEWMGFQDTLARMMACMKRLDAGDLSAYRSEHYFELHRNLFARRAAFVRHHLVDPLPPESVALLNKSSHAVLHESFYGTPLCPPPMTENPEDDAVVAHLTSLSYAAFWSNCADAKARRESLPAAATAPDTEASATPAEDASETDATAAPAPPATRAEWLESKAAVSWAERQAELQRLHELKRQRELDSVPDFEMVFSPGDMGVKPDGKTFSLHPSARMEYAVEEPVTRGR